MEIKNSDKTRKILQTALEWEVKAEENCAVLLEKLYNNNYHDIIEHIKNDEHHHQQMVKQLLKFIE